MPPSLSLLLSLLRPCEKKSHCICLRLRFCLCLCLNCSHGEDNDPLCVCLCLRILLCLYPSICTSVSVSVSIEKKKLSPSIEFVVEPGLKKKLNGERGQVINLLFPFIWHTLYTCINFILLSPFNVLYLFLFFFSIHFFPCLFHNPAAFYRRLHETFSSLVPFFTKKKILCKGSFIFTVAEETIKKEEISKEIVETGRMLRKPTIFRACF